MKNKIKNLFKRITAFLCVVMTAICATGVTDSAFVASEQAISGVVGVVLGALILVMVGSALMPTIAQNAENASTDLTTYGQDGAASIVDQWTLGVAIAVFIAIFSFV